MILNNFKTNVPDVTVDFKVVIDVVVCTVVFCVTVILVLVVLA